MKVKLLGFVLMACVTAAAQKKGLGNVTQAELEQKNHPKDVTAPAAVLLKKGETRFDYRFGEGFTMITKVEVKIKIYAKEGYEYATVEIPYYVGQKEEKVSISDAVTYNLEGGKIEKTKLKGSGEFTEKTNKYWSRKKFTMPNIKEGSIIEYSYEISSPYFHNLPEWAFQMAIPVDYSQYQSRIPEYFKYALHMRGSLVPKLEQSSQQVQRSGKVTEKVNAAGGYRNVQSEVEIDYADIINTFTLTDIPALKEEAFVNNIGNYTSSMVYELASIQIPGKAYENYTVDWESVVKKIYDSPDFGAELNKTGYFETDLQNAVPATLTNEQKVAAVFDFVKKRMNWDGMASYYCDKGVRKAYQELTGNSAEINLMLTSMLRAAGLKAHPILVSTRANGVSLYPSLSAYNFLISGVELNGSLVLLDATNKYALPNLLPSRDLNWFGRIIRDGGSSDFVDLMPKASSKEVCNLMAQIGPDGKVSGKIRQQLYDHEALWFRNNRLGMNENNYLELLEKQNSGIIISEYKRTGDTDCSLPITETYSFLNDGFTEVIGDKMYVSPLMFLGWAENPFKQESRDYPVDFTYPKQEKYSISITLPEGYRIETIPAGLNLAMADGSGSFKYLIQAGDKSVQLSVNYEMNEAIVPADSYQGLKDFYQKMVDKQKEKIVLQKI